MPKDQWDRPEPTDVGDEQPDGIYLAVGKALSAWSGVEEQISTLFAAIINAPTISDPAVHAYISIDGVNNRIEMVRAAAKVAFSKAHEQLERETLEVLTICQKWSARRNDIAHGGVDLSFDQQHPNWFLYPVYFTKKRPLFGPSAFRYTAIQIEDIAKSFEMLEERIRVHLLLLYAARDSSRNSDS